MNIIAAQEKALGGVALKHVLPVYVDGESLHISPSFLTYCFNKIKLETSIYREQTITQCSLLSPRLLEDVNVSAVVAAVVVVCLVVVVCGCGGFLLHRNGFFTREYAASLPPNNKRIT